MATIIMMFSLVTMGVAIGYGFGYASARKLWYGRFRKACEIGARNKVDSLRNGEGLLNKLLQEKRLTAGDVDVFYARTNVQGPNAQS